MSYWILLFVIPILVFAIFEEVIYYFVNRNIFDRRGLGSKLIDKLKMLREKKKMKDKPL